MDFLILRHCASVSTEISLTLIEAGATETGYCDCANGTAASEVACPMNDSGVMDDYCQNCESNFQMFDNKCKSNFLSMCDDLDCPDDRICLIEDGEPTCSQLYCGFQTQEVLNTTDVSADWIATIKITEQG